MNKKKIIFWALCLFFVAVALFSGYKLVTLLQEYSEGSNTYDDLEQYVSIPTAPSTWPVETQPTAPTQPPKPTETEPTQEPTEAPTQEPTEAPTQEPTEAPTETKPETQPTQTPTKAPTEPTEPPSPYPVVDFKALSKVNDDLVAWIHMAGPNISYPVVQGEDNDYYLNRLFTGKKNKAGAIFMDYRNNPNFKDRHTILYGHYLRAGGMFTNLRKYKQASYYKSNPTYVIVTPKKNYMVEIISAYVADPLVDPAWQLEFDSDEEFKDWVAETKKKSIFKTNVKVEASDEIITLSTCSYEFDNARFVVVGVLRKEK